jgi:hypothetical protein
MPKVVTEADTLTDRSTTNKLHRLKIERETGKCSFCPTHRKENRRRRPQPDNYKEHRRKGNRRLSLMYI